MMKLPLNKKIILFDGICNLCNNAVIKVIQYDKADAFVFASLQSDTGKFIIDKIGINTIEIDSIILYEPAISYDIKSTAILKIMNEFGGWWKVTSLLWIFPEFIRNMVYDFIAKRRYKWFGKRESCMVPNHRLKSKFLT
ncbi:DCC1-like thiol-disulfide oxidoreductase family protein [Tenacibaculum maritimum]|nr:DCC1-like thiol-disulfide oxidoreductase family protein [Tenacibaculum maritimum]MCD9562713.1 DCC1-like thiol-disulfide oxidoreductase family protein [Tenacibaculum maritimum]MCD9564775.1 DCC1-like thiol-disulfide oxidoreductase family protein [Tenacibaculum maritimum]MCD9577904.1 DCC1-like thiol-disulfide oxidoreductase family protein [Tenacibaculum maritimum]MCD9597805.1 DCC1-like thiol-disulfide oxidoreductase family protein [Tenacibaculum maritimum]MCD9612426.1 DCC1-like thiol-disulfide